MMPVAPMGDSQYDYDGVLRGARPKTLGRIVRAAKEVLAELGFKSLTVEAVASRSGVAKSTIYRHFRSRTDLALAVLTEMLDQVSVVEDSGDSLRDLVVILDKTIDYLLNSLMGPIMQGLVSEIAIDAELASAYRSNVVAHRVDELKKVVDRGISRGQLRDDLDAEELADLLLGPIYYRFFLAGTEFPKDFSVKLVASLRIDASSQVKKAKR